MNWCEVSAAVPVEQVEMVAEAMRAVAPAGVSIEDPLIPLGPEEGVRLDRRRPSVVKVYLPVDDGLGERLNRLDAALGSFGLHPELRTRTVQEEDWAEAWKEHFHVERVGERMVIRPSWREHTPRPGDMVIDLDPGMAFGTGQHPTTRMCLELLEREVRPGMSVLDVGTGSGILAVAAIKLGAARCLAVDIEPQAVQVARENARRNGVAAAIRVETGTLDLTPPQNSEFRRQKDEPTDEPTSAFCLLNSEFCEGGWGLGLDLVLANITAAAVAGLAPAFAAALRAGGRLIASGIVCERLDEVLAALRAAGLMVDDVRTEGDWCALLATRGDSGT